MHDCETGVLGHRRVKVIKLRPQCPLYVIPFFFCRSSHDPVDHKDEEER